MVPGLKMSNQNLGIPIKTSVQRSAWRGGVMELFLLYIFSDGSVAKKSNSDINIKCGGVKAVTMDVCQGEDFSQEHQETGNQKNKKMSNWHCWTDKVAETSRKQKKSFDP